MSLPTLTALPAAFAAGDTIIWQTTFTDFPATDWNATLYLSLNGAAGTAITATESGSDFIFTITQAISALLTPGVYQFATVVTNGTQTANPPFGQGSLTVLPSYVTEQTPTTAQILLAAINTCIANLLANEFSSSNFNGQSFTYKDLTMLMERRVQLQAEVLREQQAIARLRGGRDPGRIGIRFDPFATGGSPPFGLPAPWPYLTR